MEENDFDDPFEPPPQTLYRGWNDPTTTCLWYIDPYECNALQQLQLSTDIAMLAIRYLDLETQRESTVKLQIAVVKKKYSNLEAPDGLWSNITYKRTSKYVLVDENSFIASFAFFFDVPVAIVRDALEGLAPQSANVGVMQNVACMLSRICPYGYVVVHAEERRATRFEASGRCEHFTKEINVLLKLIRRQRVPALLYAQQAFFPLIFDGAVGSVYSFRWPRLTRIKNFLNFT